MEEQHHAHHVHIDPIHHKKRISWKKVGIALGALVIIAALYFIITSLVIGAAAVADASSMKLDYSIKLEDGTVIAENSSAFQPGKVGGSFGFASSKLDDAIMKLKEGDKLKITLDASDAFGEYNKSYISEVNRTETIKREFEINKTIEQPTAVFNQSFSAEPEIGKSYSIEGSPWNYSVLKIDNGTVTVSQDAKAGQFIPINEMIYANVTSVTSNKIGLLYGANEQTKEVPTGSLDISSDDENIYFKLTPEKGKTITLGYFPAKVLDFNDTTITLDYNMQYAGKKIIVEVKVDEVTKKKVSTSKPSSNTAVKTVEGAPTLQTFVMSYCPYGTQMEKGVIPAMKLLNGKANFEIRFVSYTMHGEKEDTENKRQICLREEQSAKFWTYLECFLDAGDAAGCIKSTGVDADKLSTCMTDNADSYLAVDKELNTQYSVKGSPTNILDGKAAEIYPRSPEDVKKAVCAAFTDAPAECDETLDTANPSAGFGFKAAAATSSGSGCASA
jgi:FKBP-type peptidyl-prolyl cis-trans isomerase 2